MDPQTQKFVEMQSEIQALREELSRQRTTLLSANALSQFQVTMAPQSQTHYDEEMKQLEARLQESQIETDHFKRLVKEAYDRFSRLNGANGANSFSPAMKKIIDEWLSMFEAVRVIFKMIYFVLNFLIKGLILLFTDKEQIRV